MTYTPKTKPRAHQVIAAGHLRRQDRFALLAEMGTGKSKMVCDDFGEREAAGTVNDLLIIAPAGSYLNWIEDKNEEQVAEFKKHLSEDLYGRLQQAAWISGANKTQQKKVAALLAHRDGPRALVVNVEALSSVKAAQAACEAFISTPGRFSMMVVDESTAIRGHDSARTKKVVELGRLANVRRILTGLVTPNSPLDLYAQFEFLDWRILGHRTFYTYKMRYAVLQPVKLNMIAFNRQRAGQGKRRMNRPPMAVVGYKNADELQAKIAPFSYRVLKEDCLDLPPKIYMTPREVELTDTQRRMYAELKAFATTELEAAVYVTATMVLDRLGKLHQLVCGQTVDEQKVLHEVPSNRIKVLLEVLAEHAGKVIVWAPYRHSIEKIFEAIVAEYGEGSAARFYGDNRATRGEDERRFLSDPKCRFMIATQAAGGKGNTWVNASLVVYFANSYDLEHRLQSEDRVHRDGLKHQATYIDLVASGTIDEVIIKALRKKINMATTITGENYKSWLI